MKVLIVDDEAPIRRMLARIFALSGYVTVERASAKEAVEDFSTEDGFDIVITDNDMPGGLSGLDLVSHIKAKSPEIKIIFMSGKMTPELTEEAMRCGANHVLSKPFDLEKLRTVIQP